MQQEAGAKQQIVERIKKSTNILVTVSRNPSVDELAAALGFTLMLNKMDKHATAVFSGELPAAITFLEPDKTFENSVDGLRDFIIALDKEKADRLRYKVEDDVVRIFITPYRTTITDKDLQFSQGDFNVELVVALGVEKREELDAAITAHGRILHDATVVTVNTQEEKNTLGSIDWQDTNASSYSEMLVSLSESLKTGVIDAQIATALLTGIVAATKRFSNTHTTPRVMTMAAQLMAAGANQQLIAAKLEEAQEIPKQIVEPVVDKDGATNLREGQSKKVEKVAPEKQAKEKSEKPAPTPPPEPPEEPKDGEMQVSHDEPEPEKPAAPESADEALDQDLAEAVKAVETPKPAGISVEDLKKDLEAASQAVDDAAAGSQPKSPPPLPPAPKPYSKAKDWRDQPVAGPALGGTLNATTQQAEEQKRQAERDGRNKTILSHSRGALGDQQAPSAPFNSYAAGGTTTEPPSVDVFASNTQPTQQAAPQNVDGTLGEARKAVESALGAAPFDAAHQPLQSVGAQSLPDLHQTSPPPANVPTMPLPPPPPPPDVPGIALPTVPPPSIAPAPASQTPQTPGPATLPPIAPPPASGVAPAANDPTQFKIPGQP